jgi:hypothetical protein
MDEQVKYPTVSEAIEAGAGGDCAEKLMLCDSEAELQAALANPKPQFSDPAVEEAYNTIHATIDDYRLAMDEFQEVEFVTELERHGVQQTAPMDLTPPGAEAAAVRRLVNRELRKPNAKAAEKKAG